MAKRPSQRPNSDKPGVSVRQLSDGGWVFVHPRCSRDRAEDLEEAQAMIEAGELEIAMEELRWLLSGCSEFMAAHVLLGELALESNKDGSLARAHFGYAYQLGQRTLRRTKCPGPLPGVQPANLPFYQSARGLAWCLEQTAKQPLANEIAAEAIRWDPTDPTGVGALLDELRSGGAPMIELAPPSSKPPPSL